MTACSSGATMLPTPAPVGTFLIGRRRVRCPVIATGRAPDPRGWLIPAPAAAPRS
jgi:hypothetical protein